MKSACTTTPSQLQGTCNRPVNDLIECPNMKNTYYLLNGRQRLECSTCGQEAWWDVDEKGERRG